METVSTLGASTNIQDAATLMTKNNLGSVLVADGDTVIGVFTEHDLLARVIGARLDPCRLTLGEVCTRNLISIPHDSTCQSAIRLMQTNKCRRLLVYRQNDLYGLLNISTVAHALAENQSLKNVAVNLVGGITLTVVLAVIVMLIAILPNMLDIASQAMH